MRRAGWQDTSGSVLVLVIGVLVILSLLVLTVFTLVEGNLTVSAFWLNHTRAFYLAEAGLEDALYRLQELQLPPQDFTVNNALGIEGASYSVQVDNLGGNSYRLVATGAVNGKQERVQVVMVFSGQPVFPQDGVAVGAAAGDRFYYEGYLPVLLTLAEPFNPPFTPPMGLPFPWPDIPGGTGPGDELKLDGYEVVNLEAGSYLFEELKLEDHSQLTINGPATLYIEGKMQLENDARLVTSGEVTVYSADKMDVKNRAAVVAGGPLTLAAAGDVTIEDYAQVDLQGDASIYTNEKLKLKNQAIITGDGAIACYAAEDDGEDGGDAITISDHAQVTTAGSLTFYGLDNLALQNQAQVVAGAALQLYTSGKLELSNYAQIDLGESSSWYLDEDFSGKNQSSVTTGAPLTVSIRGDMVLDDYFRLDPAQGAVTVYLDGALELSNQVQLGADPASQLVFYLSTDPEDSGNKVELKNEARLWGGISAPTRQVTMENNSRVDGALVGDTIALKNNAVLLFDDSLLAITHPGGGWEVQPGSWGGGNP